MEPGKVLNMKYLSMNEPEANGMRTLSFEVNGSSREIEIVDHSVEIIKYDERKVDSSNPKHIGSPIPGNVVKIFVKAGDAVEANKPIMTIEAMKMETTVLSKSNGVISEILVKEGDRVSDNQLIATLE